MDLHDILSPLILVFGVISLKEIVLDFMEGWRSAPPSEMRVTGHPDDLEQGPTFDSSETDGETIDAFLYIGEPWFTSTNLWAWALQAGVAGCSILGYHWHGEELLTVVDEWIGQHPLWAGMISFVCLIVALVIGALRQMFIRLMSLTCAIPMEDDTGRRFFSYVGDVPPFLWQYSPWFRAGTWCVVTGTSLIYALVGMELISALIGERFDLVFVLLLVLRWVISSIPSQLWIE